MLLQNLGTGLLRRWYVVLLGVLLTAAGGLHLWSSLPTTYEAKATAVLLPPASLVGTDGNPFLFMGGLESVLSVLNVRLNSAEVAEPLLDGRDNVKYVVERYTNSPGPVLLVTTQAESAGSAMQMMDDVLRILPENLEILQNQLRIPTFSRVEVMTIVQDKNPEVLIKDQLRTVLIAVAAGLALTVVVTGLMDRVLSSPKRLAKGNRSKRAVEQGDRLVGSDSAEVYPVGRSKDEEDLDVPIVGTRG